MMWKHVSCTPWTDSSTPRVQPISMRAVSRPGATPSSISVREFSEAECGSYATSACTSVGSNRIASYQTRCSFRATTNGVRPYIFSEAEIARLLSKTSLLRPSANSPLRPRIFRLAIVLLYTTGLRRGELLRLTLDDYDGEQDVLSIRASKFHKSRLLPLPQDVAAEIEEYLKLRSCFVSPVNLSPLLCNRCRQGWRHYTGTGLSDGIGTLLRLAQIRKPDGRLPRVHDFRHSFAVNALLRWYRAGIDVGTRLPGLAAYMGHVSIASTQYYLPLIEPLRTLASDRFAQSCGRLITPSVERIPS